MNKELIFVIGVFIGSFAGLMALGLVTAGKIQKAYYEGYERGRSVSVNSIK